MKHRHLVEGIGLVPAAIDDILEHGSLEDWRLLWCEIESDPWGQLTDDIIRICPAHEIYRTSRLWPRMIELERQEGSNAAT
jgi:hypothetical protein